MTVWPGHRRAGGRVPDRYRGIAGPAAPVENTGVRKAQMRPGAEPQGTLRRGAQGKEDYGRVKRTGDIEGEEGFLDSATRRGFPARGKASRRSARNDRERRPVPG
jgi:hypothetical protein